MRDAESGSLDACVRAGLNEVYVGIESLSAHDRKTLKKGNLKGEIPEALRVLGEDYPQVYTVGSFIYGLPGDTPRDVRELFRGTSTLPLDTLLFIPRTPLPGTPYWARIAVLRDPHSKEHYDRLRARGHSHARALRGVMDRIAMAMLRDRTLYDPSRRSTTR